jgi:hypothetical protein
MACSGTALLYFLTFVHRGPPLASVLSHINYIPHHKSATYMLMSVSLLGWKWPFAFTVGRAVARAVSRRCIAAEARASARGVCGVQSDAGTGCSSVLLCQCNFTPAPRSYCLGDELCPFGGCFAVQRRGVTRKQWGLHSVAVSGCLFVFVVKQKPSYDVILMYLAFSGFLSQPTSLKACNRAFVWCLCFLPLY